MVCRHCVEALRSILKEMHIPSSDVGLGYAVIADADLPPSRLPELDRRLHDAGFERVCAAGDDVVKAVKQAVIQHVRCEAHCQLKLSACIEEQTGLSYDTASRTFSAREGRTIEKYAIAVRIDRVKELLATGRFTVAETAYRTGYSDAAHLTRQFKSVTGLTPTQYLKTGAPRSSLAEV